MLAKIWSSKITTTLSAGLLLAALFLSALGYNPFAPSAQAAGRAGDLLQRGDTTRRAPGPIEGGVVPPAGWTQVITNTSFPTTTPAPVVKAPQVTSEADCALYENYAGAEPAGYAEFCMDSLPKRELDVVPFAPTDTGYAQDIGFVSDNFVSFTLNDFPGQAVLGTSAAVYYGMDFDPSATTLYALNDTTGQLGTISLADGSFTGLVPCTAPVDVWTGLSIDPTTGVFYASDATTLYTIDPSTGAYSLVGAFGTSLMIDIAVNTTGEMYGHDIGTDSIYSIDKATGAATLLGPTGYNANYAQGMDFDNNDGTLYIFLYQGGGANVFGTVDLGTGAVSPLAVDDPQGEFEGAIAITVGSCEPAYGADFFWVPASPAAGQWVTFSGHASGTQPLDFSWDWGDGGTGSGATAAHMYAAAGDYTVRMTATNGCGESASSHVLTVATSTVTPYYAFVNQPWDWVEGLSTPDATVQATLRRGGSAIASASTTADAAGFFAIEFRDGYRHVDILVGDEVVLSGGGVDGTIVVVDTIGGINVTEDTVVGQVSGGVFPAQGTAWVGYATALNFMVEPVAIDENGFFLADFGSQVDIDDDHVAKVVYNDPQGNEVVQVFYPGGLDVRALISEDRIEGVAAPSTTVRALVADASGPKGTGLAVSDETGFYSMELYDRGYPVDLELGNRITVTKAGRTRQMDLTMYHVSYIQTWDSRIDGTIYGLSLPAGGTEGRVDVWSASQNRWYTKYIGIGPDGSYGVDFSDLVEMDPADVMRLWVTLPDGTQQAALGWALHVGVSTSDEVVWGFTTVSSTAEITLYRGLEGGAPVDLLGTASAVADKRGFFSTTIMVGGSPQDIMPSNVVVVKAGEYVRTVFVGLVDLVADVEHDAVLVLGPAGSVAHVEGRRPGVLREDAPYQEEYGWAGGTVGPNGKALLGPLSYDVLVDDWFDVTCYLIEEGVAIHTLTAVPEETISVMMVYLPLVFNYAQP